MTVLQAEISPETSVGRGTMIAEATRRLQAVTSGVFQPGTEPITSAYVKAGGSTVAVRFSTSAVEQTKAELKALMFVESVEHVDE